MKVMTAIAHVPGVTPPVARPQADSTTGPETGPGSASSGPASSAALDFDAVYRRYFRDVWRWLRALAGPAADVEDLAQEVFIVVERKLPGFDGRHLASWLYAIAARTASDHRRRAWFRHLVKRRSDVDLEALPERAPSPVESLEREERRRALWQLLSHIREPRRTTLVLFELEGFSGEEIAAFQDIPVATVWTRLHTARRELDELVRRTRLRENRP